MNIALTSHLLWLLPLAVLIFFIGSPRFLGTIGYARTRRLLQSSLPRAQYTSFHGVRLPASGGTLFYHHIVVSRFGIFVIDSLYKPGLLSGTAAQARWTQTRWFGRARFDNPVHENFLRVQALERLLGLPLSRFMPMVVLSGHKQIKPPVPAGVFTAHQLIPHIRRHSQHVLSEEQTRAAVLKIQASELKHAQPGRLLGWRALRVALLLLWCLAVYAIYQQPLQRWAAELQQQADMRMAPERYHPDGSEKTARERWEESLVCASSVDTGRCACYEPDGQRAQVEPARCVELSLRGSVLTQ